MLARLPRPERVCTAARRFENEKAATPIGHAGVPAAAGCALAAVRRPCGQARRPALCMPVPAHPPYVGDAVHRIDATAAGLHACLRGAACAVRATPATAGWSSPARLLQSHRNPAGKAACGLTTPSANDGGTRAGPGFHAACLVVPNHTRATAEGGVRSGPCGPATHAILLRALQVSRVIAGPRS